MEKNEIIAFICFAVFYASMLFIAWKGWKMVKETEKEQEAKKQK